MAKKNKKSNYFHNDSGEYSSKSSIDSPPKMSKEEKELEKQEEAKTYEKKNGQQSLLPPEESAEEALNKLSENPHDRKFKVEMKLTLTPSGDKPFSLVVAAGSYASSRIQEILTLSLTSRRVRKVIEAILDNPIAQQETSKNDPLTAVKSDTEISTEVAKSTLGKIGVALKSIKKDSHVNGEDNKTEVESENLAENDGVFCPELSSEIAGDRTADGELLSEANGKAF